MKSLLFFLLIASVTAAAQKNQLSITGEGNFNPVTYVYIHTTPSTMGSSQKSSLGGGLEYDHWFRPNQAFGVRYEQNPSDGKLIGASQLAGINKQVWAIWPQMRWELLGMFTERLTTHRKQTEEIRIGRFTYYIQEGAGAVVTYEGGANLAHAGWSHSMAFAGGTVSNYWMTNKLALRTSALMLTTQTGCYDDPRCRPTWGVSHDFAAGFSYLW